MNMKKGLVSGYEIIANYRNRVVMACNANAPLRWAVWWLDRDGDPYSGSYSDSELAARNEFCARIVSGT